MTLTDLGDVRLQREANNITFWGLLFLMYNTEVIKIIPPHSVVRITWNLCVSVFIVGSI